MNHHPVLGDVLAWPLAPGKVAVLCAICRLSLRAPGGKLQHQRGRRTVGGGHHMLRLDRASWEELEALGLCECGVPLESHPPLPRPGPLRSRPVVEVGRRGYMPAFFRSGNG